MGRLLDVARGELGTAETPPGSNRTKYGDWYGLNAAWCGIFVSWCAWASGNDLTIPRFAYTPAGAAWFAARGRFSRTPTVGDVVFYDVSGMGRISHTGIVEHVLADGTWYAIEGNTDAAGSRTGGSVRRQHRTTVGTARGGFGRPMYGPAPDSSPAPAERPLLRRGSTGDAVRGLQDVLSAFLRARNLPRLVSDGVFGQRTHSAVVLFQQARGLSADGVVGPLTWAALLRG